MKLNPMQRKALFEKLKSTGKLKQKDPFATMNTTPQIASTKQMSNPEKVNQNYIGKVRPAKFKKIRNIMGF